jgi:L-arabinose isomerase
MKTAIWFSRHQPTGDQIADATAMGFEIVAVEVGRVIGAVDITTDDDVDRVVSEIHAKADRLGAVAVFGVAAVPVLAQMEIGRNSRLPFYGAWNVTRSVEGGKPVFSHKRWQCIGRI